MRRDRRAPPTLADLTVDRDLTRVRRQHRTDVGVVEQAGSVRAGPALRLTKSHALARFGHPRVPADTETSAASLARAEDESCEGGSGVLVSGRQHVRVRVEGDPD